MILQEAQQHALRARRHRLDLIEEQRATFCLGHEAAARLARIREGAALVAEQFALDQAIRQRPAIDRDEGTVASVAKIVQRAGRKLLAGAGLALDQYRRIDRRHAADQAQRFGEHRRLAEQIEPGERLLRGGAGLFGAPVARKDHVAPRKDASAKPTEELASCRPTRPGPPAAVVCGPARPGSRRRSQAGIHRL